MKETEKIAIARIMSGLKCSEEEAREVLEYDKAVDKGEKTVYDLSPEKERVAKQYTRADRKPTAYKFTKRTRKPNAEKGAIIAGLVNYLTTTEDFQTDAVEVVNKERQVRFTSGGEVFEITLVQKRKPKA